MSCTNCGINVDYCTQNLSLCIEVGLNQPHPSIHIGLFTNLQELMNKCAGISPVVVPEWKKKLDSCNVKPTHTGNIGIGNHIGGIIVGDSEFSSPGPHMYSLLSHTMNAAYITWSMEDSYSWCVDSDIRVKVWMFKGLQFQLMLKEFVNKIFKVRYIDLPCNIWWWHFPIYIII